MLARARLVSIFLVKSHLRARTQPTSGTQLVGNRGDLNARSGSSYVRLSSSKPS